MEDYSMPMSDFEPKPKNYIIAPLDSNRCGDYGYETEEQALKEAKKQAQKNPGSSVGIFKICKKITPPEPNVEDIKF